MKLVVASHRGPVSVSADGTFGRAAGGLSSGLSRALTEMGGSWIAAPTSDAEREWATAHGSAETDGYRFRLLELDPAAHQLHYEVISNEVLWFVLHRLFDTPVEPVFDAAFFDAWEAYRRVNLSYAQAITETDAEIVFVDDYHLLLVPKLLRERGDRRPISFFAHTPWVNPFGPLPRGVTDEIESSVSAASSAGFHSRGWAGASGLDRAHVSPLPPDNESIRAVSESDAAADWRQRLLDEADGRRIIMRADRLDLSKNAYRGFLAFEHLLETRPQIRGRVWFAAMSYPSRTSVERYVRYTQLVKETVDRINGRWPGSVTWFAEDNFPRSVAGMGVADVVLVNPVMDGLNLVAYESLFAGGNPVVVLSTGAGSFEHLRGHVLAVDPFDTVETANQLEVALQIEPQARLSAANGIREIATSRSGRDWVQERIRAATR